MSVAAANPPQRGDNVFAEMLRDINVSGTPSGAPSMSADDAEEISYADDGGDETPRDDADPAADVIDPSEDPNAPEHLSDEELLYEIFDAPGLDILQDIKLLASAYQYGHPAAVLAKAVIVSAMSEPTTVFDSGVGLTPLNFQFGFVGASGRGKGRSMGSPIRAANGTEWISKTPASGEALVDLFFDKETDDSPEGKGRTVAVRHNLGVCAKWNEIDHFAAKSGRATAVRVGTGSTVTMDAVIRSLISGEEVGDSALSRGASVGSFLEELSYRFCVWLGVQPTRAHPLLADGGGGTLQRTIWVPTRSGHKPRKAAEIHALREELARRLGLPSAPRKAPTLYVWGPREVVVQPHIQDRVMERLDLVLGDSDEISDDDTHMGNWTVRLAAIFGGWRAAEQQGLRPATVINGNPIGGKVTVQGQSVSPVSVVDDQAWRWAECLVELSRRCRGDITREATKAKLKEIRDSGWEDGERLLSKQQRLDTQHRLEVQAVMDRIIEVVKGSPDRAVNENSLRKNRLTPKQNRMFHEAKELAILHNLLTDAVNASTGERLLVLHESFEKSGWGK